jgi:hypothetical protein
LRSLSSEAMSIQNSPFSVLVHSADCGKMIRAV